jgi:hypothetical protein
MTRITQKAETPEEFVTRMKGRRFTTADLAACCDLHERAALRTLRDLCRRGRVVNTGRIPGDSAQVSEWMGVAL